MSDLDPSQARAHFELLERARAGTLTGAERQAVVLLLQRALVATMCDRDVDDHVPGWWQRVGEAYDALVLVEAPTAPPPAGGADVRPIRRAR